MHIKPQHTNQKIQNARKRMALRWLQFIVQDREITEVFVKYSRDGQLRDEIPWIGFYDKQHLVQLVDDTFAHSAAAEAIFFRVNPVQQAALGRSPNRLQTVKNVNASTSADIVRRRLLMVDVDPRRRAGKPATAEEKQAAWDVATRITDFLRAAGCSEPAIIDSGNGWHLMYRLDLPTNDDDLVKRVLRMLAQKFNNEFADVDTVVGDPARFARLPGTMNRKGRATAERPHRLCKTVSLPTGDWLPLQRELLESIAAVLPLHEGSSASPSAELRERSARAQKYIDKMPPAISGQRGHDRTFAVACRLVNGFGLTPDDAWPIMRRYNERCEPPWTETDLKRKLQQADQVALRTGQRRGHLRPAKVASQSLYAAWEPLSGPEFVGSIPDFGHAGADEVLAPLSDFTSMPWSGWCDYFAIWRLQFSHPFVPDVFMREVYWGAKHPRNWRRDLKLRRNQRPLNRGPCLDLNCILSASGTRHLHFPVLLQGRGWIVQTIDWETSEEPAPGSLDGIPFSYEPQTGPRVDRYPPKNFHCYPTYEKRFERQFQQARKTGKVLAVYWPALLLGSSPRVKWSPAQRRLLVGLVRELTRDEKKPLLAEVICGNRVAPAGNGSHTVTCPLLDPDLQYVVFGGNGRRRGRGYQVVGQTFRGWVWRAGHRLENEKDKSLDISLVRAFLHDLARLASDLDLVVAGYNPKHPIHQWRDIESLLNCLRTGSGQEWLLECGIRIYAPADYLIRWRYFFSKRLGFRWIPTAVDDPGPTTDPPADDDLRSGDDVRRWLCQVRHTQAWLADVLSRMLQKPITRQRINRLVNGKVRNVKLMEPINAIREVVEESRNSPS